MRLHDLPCYGEAEAGAARGPTRNLHELSKQARQVFTRNAAPGITHGNIDAIICTMDSYDDSPAARSCGDGISDQVREHSFNLRWIGLEVRKVGVNRNFQLNAGRLDTGPA